MHRPVFTTSNSEWIIVLPQSTVERCNRWSMAFDSTDKFIARESE